MNPRTPRQTRARILPAALLLTLLAAPLSAQGPAPASPSDADWREIWSLDVSRGGSAPIVWADSLLLVASLDRNAHLIAPGERPRIVWKENFTGGFAAAPVLAPRRIYLAEQLEGARLIALDRQTRLIRWTADAGDLVAAPVVTDERLYTASSAGAVAAWSPEGVSRWRTDLKTRILATPALLGDALVVAASSGTLYALDAATGAVRDSLAADAGPIWGVPVTRGDAAPTAIFATLAGALLEVRGDLSIVQRRSFPSRFYAGPADDGAHLLLAGHDGSVWAYDWDTAEIRWWRQLDGALRIVPAAQDGIVALGDLAGTLTLLDRATGAVLWQKRLDGAITATPLIHAGTVYVMTESGTLYAFRPTPTASR